jgi:phenylpropionate dioxygenase-like ring-hydroxylating dioxygenase large terminal subunit
MHASQSVEAKAELLEVPGYYYSDPKIFDQERERIWYKSWLFVGREEQLANPGDYLSYKIGDEPIFIVRTPSGKLQAMYNVCRHRGMRIVEGQGNCKQLRCPYHHWTYNLEGQLQGVSYPELFPGLDKSAIALPKVQVDTWGGFIFVNLDPEAESLRDYLAGVPDHLEQYGQPWQPMRAVIRATFEVPYNWKILVENYLDSYHIPMVHPQTLGSHYNFPHFVRPSMSGLHVLEDYDYVGARSLAYMAIVFPNMTIITHDEYAAVWQIHSVKPELTIIEKFLIQTPEQMEKCPLTSDETLSQRFRRIFEEDIPVCSVLQQQVKSRSYNPTQTLALGIEDGMNYFRKAFMKAMNFT